MEVGKAELEEKVESKLSQAKPSIIKRGTFDRLGDAYIDISLVLIYLSPLRNQFPSGY